MLSGDKSLENLVLVHRFCEPPAGVVHFECGGHLRWGHVTHLDSAHQCRESCIACIDLNVAPGAPCVQAVVTCLELHRRLSQLYGLKVCERAADGIWLRGVVAKLVCRTVEICQLRHDPVAGLPNHA